MELLTWITRSTVGADAVSRHVLDEVLQGPLVARLLALVQHRGHAEVRRRYGTRDLPKSETVKRNPKARSQAHRERRRRNGRERNGAQKSAIAESIGGEQYSWQ